MTDSTRSILAISMTIISGILAVCVIVLPMILPALISSSSAYQVPDSIKEWGGIIIGFYFGSSINLIKDLIGSSRGQQEPGQSRPEYSPH